MAYPVAQSLGPAEGGHRTGLCAPRGVHALPDPASEEEVGLREDLQAVEHDQTQEVVGTVEEVPYPGGHGRSNLGSSSWTSHCCVDSDDHTYKTRQSEICIYYYTNSGCALLPNKIDQIMISYCLSILTIF